MRTCARSPSYLYSHVNSLPSNLSSTSPIAFVGLANMGLSGTPVILSETKMRSCNPSESQLRTWSEFACFLQAGDSTFQKGGDDQIVVWQFTVDCFQLAGHTLGNNARLTCRPLLQPRHPLQASPLTSLPAVFWSLQIVAIVRLGPALHSRSTYRLPSRQLHGPRQSPESSQPIRFVVFPPDF